MMSDRPSAWDGKDVAPEDSGMLWLGDLSLFLYRSDKLIAATRHRSDDPLLGATVIDGFTHQHETLTQRRLAYILLRPEILEEFCL